MKIAALALVCAMFYVAPANAQATRTWVSGVGDDLNPCSRTAPCKTFAGAISKTATHGEINCLDPGAFGAVTIGKALSIVCQYTEGGALATLGSNDIVVNAPVDASIFLSGLDLQGANTGFNGVRFIAGASLQISNCIIRNFGGANGTGISFQPGGASRLFVTDTVISNNGNAGGGAGILIQPTGAGGSARVTLDNVRVVNNNGIGIRMEGAGNTSVAGNRINIYNSQVSGNTTGISAVTPVGNSFIEASVVHSTVFGNTTGILANGAAAVIRVSTTTINANGTGVTTVSSGQVRSYGDNLLDGNTAPGAFTAVFLPKA
jgi:parallel beta-helix repeat protein